MNRLNLPEISVMYRALVERDPSFEGIFVVGVKTTGIVCRPTCPARKPKRENTEYFATVKEALSYGYRPCKSCHPMELYGELQAWLKPLLAEVDRDPSLRLKDADLRARDVDPARIRRWFKKHHGMTFQAYLRSRRLNEAFGRIRHTGKVTDSAFESGYESLSGFNDAFKKITGFVPSRSGLQSIVTVTRILSPLGPFLAGATEDGICLLEFTDRRMLETQIERLRKRLGAEFVPGRNKHFDDLDRQLKEYFAGVRRGFDLPLVMPGTDFQHKTWEQLRTIPYGQTRSYREQAIAVGNPGAVRAVARANGDNRIAIIVPCHRVIGADGSLTGYGGGLWRKQHLLDLERSVADRA